jgi:hypothetical protein
LMPARKFLAIILASFALRIARHFDFSGWAPATHSLPKNQDKIATRPTQSHSGFAGRTQPPVAQHREADNGHATHFLKVNSPAFSSTR